MKSPTPSPISQAAGERDPGAYDIRSTLETITLLCEENGEPCDGFRFRELILKARTFLSTAPTTGSEPVAFYDPNDGRRQESFVWASDYPNGAGSSNVPLYATPASPVASVLTDGQIKEHFDSHARYALEGSKLYWDDALAFARALLAASMGGDKA